MHGRTPGLIALALLAAHSRLEAACIDPARLAHSAVSITRYFDDGERAAEPGFIGASGTAWFLSPTTVVTAEHVAAGMRLSTQDWKPLDIGDGDDVRSNVARIQRVVGPGTEKLAVLGLQSAVSGARSAAIRMAPLAPEDQVVTFAYPDGHPRVVGGRFVKYGDDGKLAGAALLEMYDGKDRLAIDHGASGAPVYDCDGRVAAVVTTVITQMFPGLSGQMRISTAWGTPNVLSIPIQALKGYSEAR
jgi:Trypsin-like peptidase domain